MLVTLVYALVAVVVVLQAFIGLAPAIPIGPWTLDAPIADFAALGLVVLLPWLEDRRAPAWPAALGFVAVGLVSAVGVASWTNSDPGTSVYWLLRKPVFCYVAYAITLPAALRSLTSEQVERLVLIAIGLTATLSVAASVVRLSSGFGLWWMELKGLTPNHKTLAVWLAPFVPFLFWARHRTEVRAAAFVTALALALATSKTALLTAGFGLAWVVHHRGVPLIARTRAVAAAGVLALGLAFAAPALSGSVLLEDAASSRQSLDLRAWQMWTRAPFVGSGPGTSVTVNMTEYPHYRINGVEAHGVVQKLAGETGLLGLLGYGAFLWLGAGVLRRRVERQPTEGRVWAWVGVAAALHINLLASTEVFTLTHWIPLGIAWTEARR